MIATKIVRPPSMKNNLSKLDHVALAAKGGNIPSPCGVPQNAIHTIENPGSDERAKGVTQQTAAREDSSSKTKFTPFVPFRKKEQSSLLLLERAWSIRRWLLTGKNAHSQIPKKKRVKRAPVKLWVTPVRMEMRPQRIIQTGRYMEGFPI